MTSTVHSWQTEWLLREQNKQGMQAMGGALPQECPRRGLVR